MRKASFISRPPRIEKLMSEIFPTSNVHDDTKTAKRRSTQPKFAGNLRPPTTSTPSRRWKISMKNEVSSPLPAAEAIRKHLGLSSTKKKVKKKKKRNDRGVPSYMRSTKSRELALRSPRSPRSLRDPKIMIAKRNSAFSSSSLRRERLSTERRAISCRIASVIRARGRIYGRTLQNMTEVFQAMDRNGDNKLSHTEFEEGLKRLDLGFSKDQVKELLEDFDEDRSRHIELNEFLDALENPSSFSSSEHHHHAVYDSELQPYGRYRVKGGRHLFLASENLHMLESPDINVPDLWRSRLRDYSPQNELLKIEKEKRKEKHRQESDGVVILNSPSPSPSSRVTMMTNDDDDDEKVEEEILLQRKDLVPENHLAKKIHSAPLATYKQFWRKTLRPQMNIGRAKKLAFKPCSPVVKSSILMTASMTKRTIRVLKNVSNRVYKAIRKEMSSRNHLRVLLQRMQISKSRDSLLFEDFVVLIRRICNVTDGELEILRRMVMIDGTRDSSSRLNYDTLRDQMLSCLDEMSSVDEDGRHVVSDEKKSASDEKRQSSDEKRPSSDEKRSNTGEENGVHVHINRRGSIEIENGHVSTSNVSRNFHTRTKMISPRTRKKGFMSKLEAAKELHNSGLITLNDYTSVKNQILSSMMEFETTSNSSNIHNL